MGTLLWRLFSCGLVAIIFAGCASTGPIPMGGEVYMISKQSAAGFMTNTGKLKAQVIREANEFAARQGKVAVPVAAQLLQPRVGQPSFEYQFRLVDKDDPRAKDGGLIPAADMTVEVRNK